MPRLTAKKIIEACSEATGIPEKYIELSRTDGFYYFHGDVIAILDEGNTYLNRLSDASLGFWVSLFEEKIEEWKRYRVEGEDDPVAAIEDMIKRHEEMMKGRS